MPMGEHVEQQAIPRPWFADLQAQAGFLAAFQDSEAALLICDYDGTLAPFHDDRMQARPFPGVEERLEAIAKGRADLAFVSGRPVHELIHLLPMAERVEVWGMHGREHRTAEGRMRTLEPSAAQRAALDEVQAELQTQAPDLIMERKVGSVVLHWRGLLGARLTAAKALAEQVFSPHAGRNALGLLPFDGGMELRTEDHTKGHAVEALLAGADARATVFLGDDTTDEDAFRVVRAHGGLGLLVRSELRPSHAQFSLHPPAELLSFLDQFLQETTAT